jgi:hypothetical protein
MSTGPKTIESGYAAVGPTAINQSQITFNMLRRGSSE